MEKNNLCVSIMNMNDLEEIKDSLESDFDNFWNYSILKSELENPNSTYFVVKQNNKILGFAGILVVFDVADITNIVIKKTPEVNGISKNLMQHIIAFCKKAKITQINLEVSSSNYIAINLYKKFEFKQVGLRKNYYQNEDAILLTKFL